MATFEESFLYPLVLLLVGAGLSGGLVTWLSHSLEKSRKEREIEVEKGRKEMEIKVGIVSRMAEVIASQLANAMLAVQRGKKAFTAAEIDVYYENIRKYYVDFTIIESQLVSYFSGTGLSNRWGNYCHYLQEFSNASRLYFLEDRSDQQNAELKVSLAEIRDYLSDVKQVDWNRFTTQMTFDSKQWYIVAVLMANRGGGMFKDVLKLPITAF
jgi:hypothetical protein